MPFTPTTTALVGMIPTVVAARLVSGAAGRGATKPKRRAARKVVKPKVRKRSTKRVTKRTATRKRR